MDFEYNHYYEIYNSGSGKYVNLSGDHEDGIVSNGEKVTMYARTNTPTSAGLSNAMGAITGFASFFSVATAGMR